MSNKVGLLVDANHDVCTTELCCDAIGIMIDLGMEYEPYRYQLRSSGQVKAQVYGAVSKGDYLVNYDGRLRKATEAEEGTKSVVARALESIEASGMILVSVWL